MSATSSLPVIALPEPCTEGLRERFGWAVRVRWMAIAGFLLLGMIGWSAGALLDPLPCAIAAVGASLLNLSNHYAVRKWRLIGTATAFAVLGDVLLITFLVFRTGGASSPFLAMYGVQVLGAAMLVEVRVALACGAVAVTALAGAMSLGPAALAGAGAAPESAAFLPIWTACFGLGLGLIAYVGGYVSEQLRRRERALEDSNRELRAAIDAVERGNRQLTAACKRLEETEGQLVQSEKMRALGDFVAGVAHELNNPVAILSANLELLDAELSVAADAQECEAVAEALQDCREAARRTGRIVGDLRTFSRPGSERARRDFDLNDCVRRTVRLARHLFGAGVAVELDLDPVPPIRGVAEEVDQLVLNLLSNSARAVGDAGRVVVSTERRREGAEPRVVLRVTDDGPGVPADCVDRVFEPFYTTRPEGQGVGLGLSLAFAIAERHGGTIRIDRAVVGGACFEVVLPSR